MVGHTYELTQGIVTPGNASSAPQGIGVCVCQAPLPPQASRDARG